MNIRKIAPEALAALEAGDIEALLEFQRSQFAGWQMMADDADDEDEDDDDSDDDSDDSDDDDDDDDAEYVAPTKEEWKKTQDALKKANGQAKKFRLEARQAKKGAEAKGGDAKDVEKAVAETEAKWKPRLVNKAAKAALLAAGASKPDRLIKLIDHDELEIDDDGEVEGLDDQIEELQEDYPELFKKKDDDDDDAPKRRTRRRPGSADAGGGKGRPASKQKTSAERIAAGLTGTTR